MKKKNNKILKTTKMVWRYRCQVPFLKNGINPVGDFRENGFYTRATDGLTDARMTAVVLMCSSTKPSPKRVFIGASI